MSANDFQLQAKSLLERHYTDVVLEWAISKDATDSMAWSPNQYYPRTDIAVGPFSIASGHNELISKELINEKLLKRLRSLSVNPNPRCLLAIEVVFSGSSKHILGDLLNASAIGLYGIVIGTPEIMPKILRNVEYLKKLAELDKLNPLPFTNVLVIDTASFETMMS